MPLLARWTNFVGENKQSLQTRVENVVLMFSISKHQLSNP